MKILDKIIHSSEKIIYYVLSFLLLLFVAYEIFDLITLFYNEVNKASIENKSIALT